METGTGTCWSSVLFVCFVLVPCLWPSMAFLYHLTDQLQRSHTPSLVFMFCIKYALFLQILVFNCVTAANTLYCKWSYVIPVYFQILIIQFTGKAFHVAGLGWEEWLWCILLGFTELLWGQLVLTVPKTSFPKLCRFGTKEIPVETIVEPDGAKDSKARLLWIRGLTRLQHQVSS